MSEIQRIEKFIHDYRTLNPYLQSLTSYSYEYYNNLLMKKYIKVSKHPYPQEMLNIDKDINRSSHKGVINTLQRI